MTRRVIKTHGTKKEKYGKEKEHIVEKGKGKKETETHERRNRQPALLDR